jgi:hypothetical protein
MKIINAKTEATRERIMVSIDFFLLIDERI